MFKNPKRGFFQLLAEILKFKTDSEHLEHDGLRAKNNIWLFKELPFCSRRGNMAPVGPVQHRRGQRGTF